MSQRKWEKQGAVMITSYLFAYDRKEYNSHFCPLSGGCQMQMSTVEASRNVARQNTGHGNSNKIARGF